MNDIEIRYCFILAQDRQEVFELRLDARSLELINKPVEKLPDWARLEFHQCPHCPLQSVDHPFCPVAVSLVDVVNRFDRVISYDEVDLEVTTVERRVSQRTTAQRGISSLLGILFPTSGCPHTAFFKPMVRFHLPLATKEDTVFRVTGMYLIAQFFLKQEGNAVDFDLAGLRTLYDHMHQVNKHITERLRSASITDSSINAVILLDMFTHAVPIVIEDQLEKIRDWFSPYLSDFYKNMMRSLNE
jgi:hypothetical protein